MKCQLWQCGSISDFLHVIVLVCGSVIVEWYVKSWTRSNDVVCLDYLLPLFIWKFREFCCLSLEVVKLSMSSMCAAIKCLLSSVCLLQTWEFCLTSTFSRLHDLSLDCYKYTTNELLQCVGRHTFLTRLSLAACPLVTDQGLMALSSKLFRYGIAFFPSPLTMFPFWLQNIWKARMLKECFRCKIILVRKEELHLSIIVKLSFNCYPSCLRY